MSGPNFSSELSKKKPSATVLSSIEKKTLQEVSLFQFLKSYLGISALITILSALKLRRDSAKNIIATACGYTSGLKSW